jgi:septum formation protein
MEIILGSKSKARYEILKKYVSNIQVVEPTCKELENDKDIVKLVIANAKLKATEVAQNYPDKLVLSYDTVIYCMGKILGKPKDLEEAKAMLYYQKGKIEYIYTGMCFIHKKNNIEITDYDYSKVYFKDVSSSHIEQLLKKEGILNCAGAYKYDLEGDLYIDLYEGEKENVAGLPLKKTLSYLKYLKFI